MLRLRVLSKSDKSIWRIKHLSNVLADKTLILSSSMHDGVVNIGNAKVPVKTPDNPTYVPYAFVNEEHPLSQSVIKHLKWMAQKDLLGQDIFLIGPPGPLRRELAMQYLELTRREMEYISLSRDTTESDLKQRREMKSGNSFYLDQCAVRAATEGRVLVIEGIEKAERNVLPALNNLLENREMQLDDGRFLMHHKRYDQLLKEHSKETLDSWNLVRVSDRFRVFALGLPVPKYRGHPLDPPLRSRFQARDVFHIPFGDQLEQMYRTAPSIDTNTLANLLSCATTLVTQDSASLGLPDFPLHNISKVVPIIEKIPSYPVSRLLSRMYPYQLLLNKEGVQAVEDTYKTFEVPPTSGHLQSLRLQSVTTNPGESQQADVSVKFGNNTAQLKVACGGHYVEPTEKFVETAYHQELLADMMLSHSVMDMCIIGGKGCGKSSLVRQFANVLHYRTEPVLIYQDMTSRDLLQQRYTLPNGDTTWKLSPLIEAALEGGLAVLDGINRVNPGTLAVLQRLVHDREVTLHDGTRLLRHDKYDDFKAKLDITDQDMYQKGVYRIHPSFRIIALAEPPKAGSTTQQWLNPELMTLFLYHHMKPLSMQQELEIIQNLVPTLNQRDISELLRVCQHLRNGKDTNSQSLAGSLSTRQLIRIARRVAASPVRSKEMVADAIHKACLSRFLPHLARTALSETLVKCDLPADPLPVMDLTSNDIKCEVVDGMLRIGDVEHPIYNNVTSEATNDDDSSSAAADRKSVV